MYEVHAEFVHQLPQAYNLHFTCKYFSLLEIQTAPSDTCLKK